MCPPFETSCEGRCHKDSLKTSPIGVCHHRQIQEIGGFRVGYQQWLQSGEALSSCSCRGIYDQRGGAFPILCHGKLGRFISTYSW